MNLRKTTMLATVLAGALPVLALAGGASADIAIAVAGPMTGSYASVGEQFRRGAEQAVADINAAGGVLGQKLKLEVGDDACDPKQAVAVANLLSGKNVVFVAGHYCSGSSIPASDVYNEQGVLQITPASTNPKFTERGLKNVFRVCGRDDQQGLVAGGFIAKEFAGKRIAVVHDKTAYGKGLADETKGTLNKMGIQEVSYEGITAGERDYSALVAKVKSVKADLVYFGGYHTEAGLIVRQLKEAGVNVPLMAGDAMTTEEFWSITGPAGEGTLFTFSPDARALPEAAPLVERYRKAGYEPEGYTLFTYASVQAFAQAAEKAKSIKQPDVSKALVSGEFKTALGTIGFDAKGDVKGKTYVVYRWSNGKYNPI